MLNVPASAVPPAGATPDGIRWRWLAGIIILAPILVVSMVVALRPDYRSVTPLYHDAIRRWLGREPLYVGPSGMNYLPTFIPLFAPMQFLPQALGDVLWRWFSWGGLVWGLWRLTRQDARAPRGFALAALVCLPVCLGAIRNGQANGHLGAALLLTAVCLAEERWWAAVLFVSLSVAIKPLGLAAAGLVMMAYPQLWWRLAMGLTAVILLPFLCGPADYVQSQYVAAFANLRQCAAVTENRFADLNGLLRAVNAPLGDRASLLVRGAAGLAMALFCLVTLRRQPGEARALGWLAGAAGYLMLFNPMTEANSYVVLGPAMALWSRVFFTAGRTTAGWLLAGAALSMGLLPNLLHAWLGNYFALAWFPLMAILFLVLVTHRLLEQRVSA